MSAQVPVDVKALGEELGLGPDAVAELVQAQVDGVFDLSEEAAAAGMAEWLDDPVQFVMDVFGPKEIDAWQKEALFALVRNPRVAMKACKGPGKSCVLAWFGWWCLLLHPHANGFALSITRDNLRDGLWKELAVWYGKSLLLQREFGFNAERIAQVENPKTWWLSARSFAQDADQTQQSNTLAGLHGAFVFILGDEMSDWPDGVMAAAEGIFANDGVEAHIGGAGNPTRCAGPLYNACTRDRALWVVIEITGDPEDPRRSPRVSIAYAREQITAWGRDNPWVMVNILGQFPPVQEDKLLGPNDITAAEARDASPKVYDSEPVIWALDCARFGTDKSHLRKRQGPILFRGHDFRQLNGPDLANRVNLVIQKDIEQGNPRPDYIFVDVTGLGASPYDHLRLLGWSAVVVPVDFGGAADDERFADKRAEMWDRMARWVRKYGCLPTGSNQLAADLTAPFFKFKLRGKRTCFVLESKEDMRKRGIASPDEGDAVAMTFSLETPMRRGHEFAGGTHNRVVTEDNRDDGRGMHPVLAGTNTGRVLTEDGLEGR